MLFYPKCLMAALLAVALAGCTKPQGGNDSGGVVGEKGTVSFLTGSESEPLRPLVEEYARGHHMKVAFESKGAVDIMLALKSNSVPQDALWPSNSMWVTLSGSTAAKEGQSIMRTPVVLWVKRPVAQRLGWVGKHIKMQDILDASNAGKLNLLMTSATQSNSGASAYFGFLNAFSGQPRSITDSNLSDPNVRNKIKSFYRNVKHSFGSSKWLKDYFVDHYDEYDSMINYEALGIEANQTLTQRGQEPLFAIYPEDGLAIADCPLYYVDHGDADKHKFVQGLLQYLKSPDAQQKIMALGWRVGDAGLGTAAADPRVFNSDWGVDVSRVIQPIRFPNGPTIEKALFLYQTALRKPVARAYCLDFSGSMEGEGQRQVKQAMRINLDPDEAAKHFLQVGPDDVTVVYIFDNSIIAWWVVKGNDPDQLRQLNENVQRQEVRGGTNIFLPVQEALAYFKTIPDLERHMVSVELMTDGQSNEGSLDQMMEAMRESHMHVPVYTIGFGDADASQLKDIAEKTGAKYFDGKGDLVKTFREVSGYN